MKTPVFEGCEYMRNIKAVLAYDGSRYNGWQRQKTNSNTLQEKIETMLSKLLEEPIEIHAAGRTDAGVHARGQVFHFHTNRDMDVSKLQKAANEYLPKDIVILEMKEAGERFHSRLNAQKKWYRYCINDSGIRDVFGHRFEYNLADHQDMKKIQRQLDVNRMKCAAQYLCGTHDFLSFCSLKKVKKSTVRTIYNIDIYRKDGKLYLDYYGNGFLYHMVRILTGTLIEVGIGEKNPEDMEKILEGKERELAGYLVPAQGLCLMEVGY